MKKQNDKTEIQQNEKKEKVEWNHVGLNMNKKN